MGIHRTSLLLKGPIAPAGLLQWKKQKQQSSVTAAWHWLKNLKTGLWVFIWRSNSGDRLRPLAFSCCDLPFFILCEINLWLRFISLTEPGVDEIFLIYCIEHTSSQREKMKNWNDKVALLACRWGNWSGLCCAVLWWVEIKYVQIYLDHTSEERTTKYIPSLFMCRGDLPVLLWQWYWSKMKMKPIQNKLWKWGQLYVIHGSRHRVSIDNWNMNIM